MTRRSALPFPDYLREWSGLHGGYDPSTSPLVLGWLRLVYVLARPLVRVPPDVVTAAGVVVFAAAAWVATMGGRELLLAAALVALTGLVDGLDGAVAVLSGRATRWGYVLDSVVDRLGDAAFVAALWAAGAPGWLCVTGGALAWLQEYVRARAAGVGMADIGVVTVWERPTRVIVTSLFLLGAGLWLGGAAGWATAGAAAWLTLGVVGISQLTVVLRRRLR